MVKWKKKYFKIWSWIKKNTNIGTENTNNVIEIKIVKDLENNLIKIIGLDDELFKYDILFEFFHFRRKRIYSPILKAIILMN